MFALGGERRGKTDGINLTSRPLDISLATVIKGGGVREKSTSTARLPKNEESRRKSRTVGGRCPKLVVVRSFTALTQELKTIRIGGAGRRGRLGKAPERM